MNRFIRFCAVGGSMALLSMTLLWLLVDVADLNYLLSFAVTFLVANTLGYLGARRFTFETTRITMTQGLLRYFAVTGASLLLNTGAMAILVSGLHLWPVAASALLSAANAPVNFLVHRRVTFGLRAGGTLPP
jgi:putative flippase GtrA